jgi:hypothetical protein
VSLWERGDHLIARVRDAWRTVRSESGWLDDTASFTARLLQSGRNKAPTIFGARFPKR